MMNSILLVDDDPHILIGYRRRLRRMFDVHIAEGPKEGLEKIASKQEFAVVISDMQMPGMNGVEFLQVVKKNNPEIVRMMLTGNADQQTAMDAVNGGAIFRFLTKPCDNGRMIETINDAIRQYELLNAERDLLQKTVRGSIKLLVEVLSIADPDAFGRSMKLKDRVIEVIKNLDMQCDWMIEMAAMLANLGLVTLPVALRQKMTDGGALKPSETELIDQAPVTTCRLLSNIPRLEPVVEILRHITMDYADNPSMPVESRLLRILIDLSRLETQGCTTLEATDKMRTQGQKYDEKMLDKILAQLVQYPEAKPVEIRVSAVHVGHVLAEDVRTNDERLLIRAGQTVTDAIQASLLNYARYETIPDRVVVLEAA